MRELCSRIHQGAYRYPSIPSEGHPRRRVSARRPLFIARTLYSFTTAVCRVLSTFCSRTSNHRVLHFIFTLRRGFQYVGSFHATISPLIRGCPGTCLVAPFHERRASVSLLETAASLQRTPRAGRSSFGRRSTRYLSSRPHLRRLT